MPGFKVLTQIASPAKQDCGHLEGLVGSYRIVDKTATHGFETAISSFAQKLMEPDATMLERPILSPHDWLADPYYSGPISREFWPQKFLDFELAADGNNVEILLTGSIGQGKTALLKAICLYDIYRLSCFVEPQRALGVGSSECLVMVLVSLNVTKAKAKLFSPLRTALENTPYFRNEFRLNPKRESVIELPKGILVKPGVTGESAIHSEDTIFVGLSEANFLPIIENSKKKRGDEELDVAADLVEAAIRRMKTRFQNNQYGKLPLCRLVLDSSRQYPDDYIERRIKEIHAGQVRHPTVIIEHSIWEAKRGVKDNNGVPIYSGNTFPVELGSEQKFSRVLTEEEVPFARGEIMRVPVEMRSEFETDLEGAIRDYGGRAVLSLRPLIPNRDAIVECTRTPGGIWPDEACIHPFSEPATNFRDSVKFYEEILADPLTRRPRIHPTAPRAVHVDFGLTGDCLGFAMGHIERIATNTRGSETATLELPCRVCRGEKFTICPRCNGAGTMSYAGAKVRCAACKGLKQSVCRACEGTGKHGATVQRPIHYIDMVLQVIPPSNGQIQFDDIEGLLKRLRHLGFFIPVVTADGFESAQFIQRQLNLGAAVSEVLSMDRAKEPYLALRNAIQDKTPEGTRRISFYHHPVFFREITTVEDRQLKIDHPHKGSKDVSDGVAGVVFNCERIPQLQYVDGGANLSVEMR